MGHLLLHAVSSLLMASVVLLAGAPLRAAPGARTAPLASVVAAPAGVMIKKHPSGAWEDTGPEIQLTPGASLKCGTEVVEAKLSDGTRVEIEPSSVVQFQASTEIQLDTSAATRVARVDLKEGSVRVTIPAGGRPLMLMATNQVFAAFRSGTGRARMHPEGLVVAVDEGTAKVAASGRWTAVAAGHYQMLRTRGMQQGPKPLPPKPGFVADLCHAGPSQACAIGLLVGGADARLGARWKPAESGQRFVVELMRDRDGGPVITRKELAGDQTSFTSEPLPVGAYMLSLRAVTPEGVEGARALRPMRVVRLLPDLGAKWIPGARVIVLPQGRKVRIDGPSGVQVSLVEPHYGAAPASLEIGRYDHTRTVRFRVEGDGTDDAAVVLERSALRADVELTPRTAMWPRDRVELRIRMQDPRGRSDVTTMHPRTRVLLNDKPIPLGLVRKGNAWVASIPARSGNGPWVIRVDVLGTEGDLLGQGLLHVVGKKEPRSRFGW